MAALGDVLRRLRSAASTRTGALDILLGGASSRSFGPIWRGFGHGLLIAILRRMFGHLRAGSSPRSDARIENTRGPELTTDSIETFSTGFAPVALAVDKCATVPGDLAGRAADSVQLVVFGVYG